MRWIDVELGEFADITAGVSPPGSNILESPGQLPFHQGTRDFGSMYPSHRVYCEEAPRIANKEDILISVRAPIGRINVAPCKIGIGRGLMSLRTRQGLDQNYLYYVLISYEDRWTEYESAGSVFANLGKSDLASLQISLPPLTEQRGIAATLGALDDKIESNRRVIEKLDTLFHSKWESLYESDSCSTEVLLADIVTTQYGITASAKFDGNGIKLVRVTDINKANWINWDAVPNVEVSQRDNEKYHLRKGDLMVARMADPGKSAIFDDEAVPAVFASYLVRLQTSSYEDSLFLFGFLKSKHYLDYAQAAMSGSVQKNMNARVIVNTQLRWPLPVALNSFAKEAQLLRMTLNSRLREIETLASLRDTLLPELLSGRVRVPEAIEAVEEVL